MPNVEKCSANNGDDRGISDVQLLSRASVKRESRSRPAKYNFAKLTPLRLCIADAHRGDGKRLVVQADEKLTAFVELESAINQSKILAKDQNSCY
jgi:hypothetical protein